MTDEDDDSEKTRIFLPGADKPKPGTEGAAGDPTATEVDFDITAETGFESTATEVDFDITAETGFKSDAGVKSQDVGKPVLAAKPRAKRPPQPARNSSIGPVSLTIIVVVLALAAYLILK